MIIAVLFLSLMVVAVRGYKDRTWHAAEKADVQWADCYRIGQMCHNYLYHMRELFPIKAKIETLKSGSKGQRNEANELQLQLVDIRAEKCSSNFNFWEIHDEDCKVLFSKIRSLLSDWSNSNQDIINFSSIISKKRKEVRTIKELQNLYAELLQVKK